MSNLKFYSEKEIELMTKAIKNNEKLTVASVRFSKEFNRSANSVYVKLLSLAGRMGINKSKKPAKVVTQQSEKGIALKSGFVFDFKPQRAEMHSNHVRLFF